MDIVISSILLVFIGPFILTAAFLIKMTSQGPAFFPCDWVGQNGRQFRGYKLRSMVANAASLEATLRESNEMIGPAFKVTNDPRITPVGRFIRKYSIDELPQLWSVLKGDLSLVGPRAPRTHEYAQFTDFQKRKMTVKPGITCLWQVEGRHLINNYDDWVALDLEYIRRWSLWLDVTILFRTIGVVLRGTGQ